MGRNKYDGLTSKIASEILNKWISEKSKKVSFALLNINRKDIEFDIHASLSIISDETVGFEVLDSTGADGRDFDDDGVFQTPFIIIDFAVNNELLPKYWSEIYFYLCDVVRHEIEHITQEGGVFPNYKNGKPGEDDSLTRELIKTKLLPSWNYYLLPKEIDANLQGLRLEAKKRRKPFIKIINKYLDLQELDGKHRKLIFERWRSRAKQIGGIPKF
jgi:hypothetical protein